MTFSSITSSKDLEFGVAHIDVASSEKRLVRVTLNTYKKWHHLHQHQVVQETRRDRLKSAPYLRLKNIQRTTIGNICKNFFQKKIWNFFFEKSIFLESRTMPENSKRGHSGSLNVFTNRKLQKNARGYALIKSGNFRKSRIVPKKTQRGDPLVSPAVLLEA